VLGRFNAPFDSSGSSAAPRLNC